MKVTRTGKRRAAVIKSVKMLLTSASLAALGGWAAISAANGSPLAVAQVDATATVQSWLNSRSTTAADSTATPAASTTQTNTTQASTTQNSTGSGAATTVATSAPAATVAPTATAVPTQVVVQPNIRTRSSK